VAENLLTVRVTPGRVDVYSRFMVSVKCHPKRRIAIENADLMLQLLAADRGVKFPTGSYGTLPPGRRSPRFASVRTACTRASISTSEPRTPKPIVSRTLPRSQDVSGRITRLAEKRFNPSVECSDGNSSSQSNSRYNWQHCWPPTSRSVFTVYRLQPRH